MFATVGINSQKEFIYTSNCNLDLRENKKNNHKNSGFTCKHNSGKITGRSGRIHYFQRITMDFQRRLYSVSVAKMVR